MLSGRMAPERGGRADNLDIVGVDYYPDNQWFLGGSTIPLGHSCYRPLRELLGEIHHRFGRPILVAETGAEGSARTAWLFYVAGEIRATMAEGVPVEGICLHPILDYPEFDIDLLGHVDADDRRRSHAALAEKLARQQAIFEELVDALSLTPLLGSAA
jgi:hypothetical protein